MSFLSFFCTFKVEKTKRSQISELHKKKRTRCIVHFYHCIGISTDQTWVLKLDRNIQHPFYDSGFFADHRFVRTRIGFRKFRFLSLQHQKVDQKRAKRGWLQRTIESACFIIFRRKKLSKCPDCRSVVVGDQHHLSLGLHFINKTSIWHECMPDGFFIALINPRSVRQNLRPICMSSKHRLSARPNL